jgi:hypothetical protein
VLWLLALLTAVAGLCDGLTTWWGLSRHPDRVVETNPLVMPLYRRVSPPVFVTAICLLDAAASLGIGLLSRRFGIGSVGQVVFLVGIAAAAVNNARNLRRLRRWSG